MKKEKIANVVGFIGGGVFFLLNIATEGKVPGGAVGGVLGYLIGAGLTYLVFALVPAPKKPENSN